MPTPAAPSGEYAYRSQVCLASRREKVLVAISCRGSGARRASAPVRGKIEHQTRRCTMGQQTPLGVGQAAFSSGRTAPGIENATLGGDGTGLCRYGADERDLEFERRVSDTD